MRQELVNIYKFNELSKESKRAALITLSDINVDHDWWKFVYEDAATIGLVIGGFDQYYNLQDCTFTKDAQEIAETILKEHGEICDTFKAARDYMRNKRRGNLKEQIKNCYSSMLEKEYDYLISNEAIIGTIESNDYEFWENGDLI